MGNAQQKSSDSATAPKKSLAQIVDYVAANYILTMNFEDMKKLADMNYCNNLVILTSKVISNNLSNLEIEYLSQRLKDGKEINEMTKDNVIYLNKKNLDNLDVKNSTQKRRLCIGIAKHYVKVAHIFAAIATTINPTMTYTDPSGQQVNADLSQKMLIPEDANVKIKRINLCSQRINALINNQDFNKSSSSSSDQTITIKPKFCDINLEKGTTNSRTLVSEPGIPELEKLYYDVYDYDQGGFTGMSDKMRKEVYEKDVETFYKAFSGYSSIPVDANGNKTIKKFSDISLKDYHKSEGCKYDGVYNKSYSGSLKDKLFKSYAEHINKMMETTTNNQNKLLAIIDELFSFNVDPLSGKKQIVVNPKLSEQKLQEVVETTRKIIIELYLTCEKQFLEGLEIFEAIVEKQILDTSKEQIKELEKVVSNTIASSDISETIDKPAPPAPVSVEAAVTTTPPMETKESSLAYLDEKPKVSMSASSTTSAFESAAPSVSAPSVSVPSVPATTEPLSLEKLTAEIEAKLGGKKQKTRKHISKSKRVTRRR